MRAVAAPRVPLGVRISHTDWVEGGWDTSRRWNSPARLKARGWTCRRAPRGGCPQQKIPWPGLPGARRRGGEGARGVVTARRRPDHPGPQQAQAILAEGKADLVALARALLDDPRWVWHAADALAAEVHCPPQYARARPGSWRAVRDRSA